MRQTPRQAFVEALVGTLVGLGIAFIAQAVLFELYHVRVSNVVNAWITFWMTIVSVVRSYVLRRAFDWWHHRITD